MLSADTQIPIACVSISIRHSDTDTESLPEKEDYNGRAGCFHDPLLLPRNVPIRPGRLCLHEASTSLSTYDGGQGQDVHDSRTSLADV